MVFEAEELMKDPSQEFLRNWKQEYLFLLANHLELPMRHYQTKQEITNIVVRYLIENALLDEKA